MRKTPMNLAYRIEDGAPRVYSAEGLYAVVGKRGQKAGAKCVMCGMPVALRLFTKPRKGKRVTSDFQHLKRHPCKDVVACDVHDRAFEVCRKAIIKGMSVPVPDGGSFNAVDVVADKAMGDIRPDIILIDASGARLLVEIMVTHPVTPAKEMFLRSMGHPTFEVDMSGTYRRKVSDEDIENSIFGSAFRKRWIVRPGDPKVPMDVVTSPPSSDAGYMKALEQVLELDAVLRSQFNVRLKSKDLIEVVIPVVMTDDRQKEMPGFDAGSRTPRGGMDNPRAYATRKLGKSNGGMIVHQGPSIFDAHGIALKRGVAPPSLEKVDLMMRSFAEDRLAVA